MESGAGRRSLRVGRLLLLREGGRLVRWLRLPAVNKDKSVSQGGSSTRGVNNGVGTSILDYTGTEHPYEHEQNRYDKQRNPYRKNM